MGKNPKRVPPGQARLVKVKVHSATLLTSSQGDGTRSPLGRKLKRAAGEVHRSSNAELPECRTPCQAKLAESKKTTSLLERA